MWKLFSNNNFKDNNLQFGFKEEKLFKPQIMHSIMLWSLSDRNLLDLNYQNNVKALKLLSRFLIQYHISMRSMRFLDLG